MRKIIVLAILAAVPVIAASQNTAQPGDGAAGKHAVPGAKLAADSRNDQQAAETAAIKSLADAIAKSEQGTADSRQQERTDEQANVKAERGLVWVGVAQTVALILTFGAIAYETMTTADTAKAAMEAAREAKRSTQLIIDKDRARLYVEPGELFFGAAEDPPNRSGVTYKIRCYGATEAVVISAHGEIVLTGRGDSPNLKTNDAMNLAAVIPPDDKGVTRTMYFDGVAGTDAGARFMKNELCANLHGWIVYRDVFKSVWEYEFSYIKMFDGQWIGSGGAEKPYTDDKHGLFE